MLPLCNNEMWYVALYCILAWVVFSLALYLPDASRRKKEAMVGGLLNLVLVSVLSMLSGFAAEQLGTSMGITAAFQISGVLLCSLAVSRVVQMLSWPRTWVVGVLAVAGYLLVGVVLAWCLMQQIT